MPRLSLRTAFVATACIAVLIQLVSVTLAALPPNRYSDAARPHLSYLDPYFTQNWRLFAPNPVAEDRSILFQGAYIDASGQIQETSWLDWTAVELDLIHHRLVGNRAGYITNKMFGPLRSRSARLNDQQEQAARSTDSAAPPHWAALRDQLLAIADRPATADAYLRYERAATQLATDALIARWPHHDFVAVRYSLRRHRVVPYANRHDSGPERTASRPPAINTPGGWRVPSPGDAAEQRAVADFYRRHR